MSIEFDIAHLEINDQILVSGLPLPEGVTTPVDESQVVAQVTQRRIAGVRGEDGEDGEDGEGGEGAPAAADAEGDGE